MAACSTTWIRVKAPSGDPVPAPPGYASRLKPASTSSLLVGVDVQVPCVSQYGKWKYRSLASGDNVVEPIAIQSAPRERQASPFTNSDEPWQRYSFCWENVTRFLGVTCPVNRP